MDDRITELEIKAALQEDLLETLNAIVGDQAMQISRLQAEVRELAAYLRSQETAQRGNPGQEVPPHLLIDARFAEPDSVARCGLDAARGGQMKSAAIPPEYALRQCRPHRARKPVAKP